MKNHRMKPWALLLIASSISCGLLGQPVRPPFTVTWFEGKCVHCKMATYLERVQWVSAKEAWGIGSRPRGAGDYVLVHTTDAGRTWREVPHTWQYAGPPAFSFFDASHGWFSCWNVECPQDVVSLEVRRTVDGGKHWQIMTREEAVTDMAFSDDQNGIGRKFWIDDTGGVARTNDGGRTWSNIDIPNLKKIERTFFLSGKIAWVVDDRGGDLFLFRTLDEGHHWEENRVEIPDGWPELREFSFIDQNHGWLVMQRKEDDGIRILATKDGGMTWLPLAVPPVRKYDWWSEVVRFISDKVGFVFSTESDPQRSKEPAYAVLYTVDGGAQWQKFKLPYSVYSCQSLDATLVCSANRKNSHFGILTLTPSVAPGFKRQAKPKANAQARRANSKRASDGGRV